jgi:general nucleoside transport system permease protein
VSAARLEATVAAVALLIAMAAGSILMIVAGASPLAVWGEVIGTIAPDPQAWGQVVFEATPLVFTGLSVVIALRAGLFNIGGEGQMVAGALACGALGAALPAATPAVLAIPICLAAAALAGGALGAATGALRAYRGAHEVIVAILLNAIVAGVALWIGNAFLFRHGSTMGPPIAPGAELPGLGIAGSNASTATLVALAAALAIWWLFARTRVGTTWRWVGQGPRAAAAAGIDVARTYVVTMAAAGAMAGLVAANYVLGSRHAYQNDLGIGAGYLGIAVALLGGRHPLGVVLAALLLGFLQHAGLVASDLVPKAVFDTLEAVIIVAVAAASPVVRRHVQAQRSPS